MFVSNANLFRSILYARHGTHVHLIFFNFQASYDFGSITSLIYDYCCIRLYL